MSFPSLAILERKEEEMMVEQAVSGSPLLREDLRETDPSGLQRVGSSRALAALGLRPQAAEVREQDERANSAGLREGEVPPAHPTSTSCIPTARSLFFVSISHDSSRSGSDC